MKLRLAYKYYYADKLPASKGEGRKYYLLRTAVARVERTYGKKGNIKRFLRWLNKINKEIEQ